MLTKDQLQPIFERKYDRKDWYNILRENFSAKKLNEHPKAVNVTNNEFNASAYILGEIDTSDDYKVGIYEVEVPSVKNITRNKVGLRGLLSQVYQSDVDAALIVFVQDNKWRFSYVSELTTRHPETGERLSQSTDTKRYTYLLGNGEKAKTAAGRIANIKYTETQKGTNIKLENLKEAFSVEALNKEFYNVIAEKFSELVGGERTKNKKLIKYERILQLPSISENKDANRIYHEFAVRLIGRVVFCWFLKMKKSNSGISLLPEHLLSSIAVKNNSNYYHTILEKVFFQTLNTPIEQREQSLPAGCELIPFLNGGLFEPQYQDYYNSNKVTGFSLNINTLIIPDHWLLDLFEKLEQFNFTIDENSSNDIEVSVDPEMLGSIFENLLAEIDPDSGETARKATGSFYTPREIVDYMAVESLVYYLHNYTSIIKERIEPIFKIDNEHDLNKLEVESILTALDKLKILDPACGSGAFPIGILQKMVLALQKLDKNAEWWIKQQINKNNDPTARMAVKEKLQKNPDYARKIGIIQNTLYGVDIQPIAAEISKLRCFLTLIVDEHIDESKSNRGIEPLPNLEFKFVTADTLLKLPAETEQIQLFNEKNNMNPLELLKEIQQVRLDYLQSYGEDKQVLKERFKQLQKQIFDQQMLIGIVENNRAFKISTWNPFSYEKTDWFDPEWMFGVKGFDLIIGNPPYVEHKKLKHISYALKPSYEVYTGSSDLSVYFFERAFHLLKEKGAMIYINTNKFFNTGYGRELRKFLLKQSINSIINFEQVEVFDGVLVSSVILNASKTPPKGEHSFQYSEFRRDKTWKHQFIEKIKATSTLFLQNSLDDSEWAFASSEDLRIKKKIDLKGTLLKDIDSIEIKRGVTTGYDPAFILEDEHNELDSDTLKKLVKGKDIKRYMPISGKSKLLFIPWHYPLHEDSTISGASIQAELILSKEYPLTYKHLLQHQEGLNKRNQEETGIRYEWYCLQRCAASYYHLFDKPKILWPLTADKWGFTIDLENHYLTSGGFFLVSEKIPLQFLLALLNSQLIEYYFAFIGVMTAGGAYTLKKATIEALPIVIPNDYKDYIILVDKTLLLKSEGKDTLFFEKQIDHLIYSLYDLTEEEINIVNEKIKQAT